MTVALFAKPSLASQVARLFARGEQGAWYDPSDLSTLFQDAAGTIPVTAAGQPVGLMLDKSGRNNHASQATATSRPVLQIENGLPYLACDGVDDWMTTGSVDFRGTSRVLFAAGVRRFASPLGGTLIELSANYATNQGAFAVFAPGNSDLNAFGFRSNGTLAVLADTPPVAPPVTAVIASRCSIPGRYVEGRVNGAVVVNNTGDQGTGNYGNYALYLFRRGGTTLPFNGRFYGAVIRGAESSESQIRAVERYLNSKTRAW